MVTNPCSLFLTVTNSYLHTSHSQPLTSIPHSHKHLPPCLTVTTFYLHTSHSQPLTSIPHIHNIYLHTLQLQPFTPPYLTFTATYLHTSHSQRLASIPQSYKNLPPYLTVTNILQYSEGSCQDHKLNIAPYVKSSRFFFLVHQLLRSPDVSGLSLIG